jgi:hypothetical protein
MDAPGARCAPVPRHDIRLARHVQIPGRAKIPRRRLESGRSRWGFEMNGHRVFLLAVAVALALAAVAAADTLVLKNGGKFEGSVVEETADGVRFKTIGGILEFSRDQIDHIEYGASRIDRFNERFRKVSRDDVPALLDLARWCEEQRLVSQRRKVLRLVAKQIPDHPEVHRGLGEIWRDGKWVRHRGDPDIPAFDGAGKTSYRGGRMTVTFPAGFSMTVSTAAPSAASATGPDHYRVAPRIEASCGAAVERPAAAYPEAKGWAKPEAVKVGALSGIRTRRRYEESRIDHVELVALVGDGHSTVTVRMTALLCEEATYRPAFDLVLDSVKLAPRAADYVNTHYDYAVDIPDGPRWKHEEDEVFDLAIWRDTDGEAREWCILWIITGDEGEEFGDVDQYFKNALEEMKTGGDLSRDAEITVAGQKARIVDGTLLEDGVPIRRRVVRLTHGKRIFLIDFKQHEYGQEHSEAAWTTVMKTFKFTK